MYVQLRHLDEKLSSNAAFKWSWVHFLVHQINRGLHKASASDLGQLLPTSQPASGGMVMLDGSIVSCPYLNEDERRQGTTQPQFRALESP